MTAAPITTVAPPISTAPIVPSTAGHITIDPATFNPWAYMASLAGHYGPASTGMYGPGTSAAVAPATTPTPTIGAITASRPSTGASIASGSTS